MHEKILLDPAHSDSDYTQILIPKGAEITVRKLQLDNEKHTITSIGDFIRGKVLSTVRVGEVMTFKEGDQLSPIRQISVDPKSGEITFLTQRSLYKVIGYDSEVKDRKVSLDYLKKGFLDFADRIPNGFVDGGRKMKYERNKKGKYEPISPNREVIVVDVENDHKLNIIIEESKKWLSNFSTQKQKISALAMFVSNHFGGSRNPKIEEDTEDEIEKIMKKRNTQKVKLGDLSFGVCRHRAILYKLLADVNGIRSRLIRGHFYKKGFGHAWNIVMMEDGKYYVVDVMQDPATLYPEDSPAAKIYMRTTGSGEMGGIGGKSLVA